MALQRKLVKMTLILALCSSAACAETITFSLSGTMADGGVLSGTMAVDNVAGMVTAANFTVGAPDSDTFTVVGVEGVNSLGVWAIEVTTVANPGSFPKFVIFLPTDTLVGYEGGPLCSNSVLCNPTTYVPSTLIPLGANGGGGTDIPLQSGSACGLAAPNIMFNGENIAGQTTSVVAGQQITLTGQVPACESAANQKWSLPAGTAVGGWVGTDELGAVTPLPTNTMSTYGPFYWTIPSSTTYDVTYQYTNTEGKVSPKATAQFQVEGPTAATVSTSVGKVAVNVDPPDLPSGTYLQLGGTSGNVGILFTASATEPPGYSDNFEWVQLITSDEWTETPFVGSVQLCIPTIEPTGATFPGLDTQYPYDLDLNQTDDNPSMPLTSLDKAMSRGFSATMYLMWNSLLSGSIPIPLGHVNWRFTAAAKDTNPTLNKWVETSGGASAGSFVKSSSYPAWTSFVPYTGGLTCADE
jgi:hypothetical protein